MTDREAMKMALEALLTCGVDYDYDENTYNTFDAEDVTEAIDALRQALAQPEQEQAERDEAILHLNIQGLKDSDDEGWREVARLRALLAQSDKQEPVAWWNPTTDNASTDPYYRKSKECIPLYTAPVGKPWVSLTDEEIEWIVDLNTSDDAGYDIFCDGHSVARAVIDKLKELNK